MLRSERTFSAYHAPYLQHPHGISLSTRVVKVGDLRTRRLGRVFHVEEQTVEEDEEEEEARKRVESKRVEDGSVKICLGYELVDGEAAGRNSIRR
jgi:hypothetical protein